MSNTRSYIRSVHRTIIAQWAVFSNIKNIIQDTLDKYTEIGDKLDRNNVTSHTGKLGWV